MPTTIEHSQSKGQKDTDEYLHALASFTSPGSTDPVRLSQEIVVQIAGTATAIDAVFERSFADPASGATWAPAEDDHFIGSVAADAGIAARAYFEPIQAYYRVRVISISGGTANVSIVGRTAQ